MCGTAGKKIINAVASTPGMFRRTSQASLPYSANVFLAVTQPPMTTAMWPGRKWEGQLHKPEKILGLISIQYKGPSTHGDFKQ